MSDSIKWLLWILGLIALLWCSLTMESCRKNGWENVLCKDCAVPEVPDVSVTPPVVTPPPAAEKRYPADFAVNGTQAFKNPGYDDYRARILEGYREGQVLEITGDYYAGEPAPEGFDNAGMARAAAVRDLLTPDIPEDVIILKSNEIAGEPGTEKYIKGHSYRWISAKPQEVEQINGCTTIRFAFGSADGKMSAEVSTELDKIAERIRTTGEKVTITGHTDNVGSPAANLKLGKRRAMDIRREFINRKVLREQIITASEGQTDPVAANDTDRGRAENRRTEVCITE